MTGLTIASDAVRRFHRDWQQGPSREERARQEFAELLVLEEAGRLRPPSLPSVLACDARVTPAMHAVWSMRLDLQSGYDLVTVAGYYGLVAWSVRHGWREYPVLREQLPALAPMLGAAWPAAAAEARLSQFTCALWLSRPDLQEAFAITSAGGREGFAEWFLKHGVLELLAWPVLSPLQADWLLHLETPKLGDPVPVARFLLAVWASRPDLQETMPISEERWGERLWEWFFGAGLVDLGVPPDWVLRCASTLGQAGVKITWV